MLIVVRRDICFKNLVACCVIFTSTLPSILIGQDQDDRERPTRFNLSVNGGQGLVLSSSPYTLGTLEVGLGLSVMNFDRDPGDIDFVRAGVQGAIGLPGPMEFFFRLTPRMRSDAINLDPLRFPVPPLDLIVDVYPNKALRPEPHFLFAQETPYKTYFIPPETERGPGLAAFGSSSGDTVLGLKLNLLDGSRSRRPALGVQVYVELPTEKPTFNSGSWRKKLGVSGERDLGFDFLLSQEVWKAEFLFNLGYKRIGDPESGTRVQLVNSGASRPEDFWVGFGEESKLDLKDEIRLVGGASFPAFQALRHQVWFVGEFFYKRFVGGGTPVQSVVHPFDTLVGLQFSPNPIPWMSFGAAWLLHWNSAGKEDQRVSPFLTPDGRGDINFTPLVDLATAGPVIEFLKSRGVTLASDRSKIFATNNPAFDDWRNIPSGPAPVISKGHNAAILFINFRPSGH